MNGPLPFQPQPADRHHDGNPAAPTTTAPGIDRNVARTVHVAQRVVQDVAVPVQRLRTSTEPSRSVARLRYDGVGLSETAQDGIEVPGVVEVQPDCNIFPLACEAPRGGCRAGVDARLAPRLP